LTDDLDSSHAASPGNTTSSGSASPEGTPLAAKILAFSSQFRSLDGPLDEARTQKIANLKKALADGTYNVSADEVARKIISDMQEP
jgi:anti-sigma28 factor (negative regulator of flagellin synthesis)